MPDITELPPFEIPGMVSPGLPSSAAPAPDDNPGLRVPAPGPTDFPVVPAKDLPPFQIPGLLDSRILQRLAPQLAPQRAPGGPGLAPVAPAAPGPAGSGLHVPTRHSLPDPPKPHYSDPLTTLGNPLTVLALIGSLFTRTPAVTAMKALANAMKAQRAGDQQNYLEQYQQYQQALQKAHIEQQQEAAEYKRDWENKRLDLTQRMAGMRKTATRRGDSAMLTYLDTPGGNPGSLIDQRAKAGKPITEAIIKAQAIRDYMKEDPGLTLAQASLKYETDKAKARTEGKPPTQAAQDDKAIDELLQRHSDNPDYTRAQAIEEVRSARRGNMMSTANAKDIELRKEQIKEQNPGITDRDAQIRAMDEHNAAKKAPPGTAWATLDPTIQNVVNGFPEARDALARGTYKITPARQGNLMSGLRVIKENDRVAEYVAENPDAVGLLPTIYNRAHSTLVSKPEIHFETPQEAQQFATKLGDDLGHDLKQLGGKMRLPDGRILDPGLAERAAILNKMLIQTGLSDAAQMSASGRGGTIYLDKLMSEKIYNQQTNPYVLLNFLADRSQPAALNWKQLDPRIDFGSEQMAPEYRSRLLSPGGIESLLARAYPMKGKQLQPGTVMDGYRFKGGNPADRNSWEPVQ